MKLPGCAYQTYCPYDTFKSIVYNQLPEINACALLPQNRGYFELDNLVEKLLLQSSEIREYISKLEINL